MEIHVAGNAACSLATPFPVLAEAGAKSYQHTMRKCMYLLSDLNRVMVSQGRAGEGPMWLNHHSRHPAHQDCTLGSDRKGQRMGGGGGWHKASVLGWLPLAPIGLSPLLILTLCGSEHVLVVSTEPLDDLPCLTTPGGGGCHQSCVCMPVGTCRIGWGWGLMECITLGRTTIMRCRRRSEGKVRGGYLHCAHSVHTAYVYSVHTVCGLDQNRT